MISIIILTGAALILSVILVVVNTLINKEDPRVSEIEKMLPGLNCGGCGYGSCKGMACEILKNREAYLNCRPLRGEKKEAFIEFLKTLK